MLQFSFSLSFTFGVVNGGDKKVVIRAFGKWLREVRKSKKLSQERLGHRIGLTVSQVGRIERGKINTSLMMIYNLSIALEVPPHYLLMTDFSDDVAPKQV